MKNKNHSNKQSGQVALFVALIFQVLFVFFAMIINIGLLVHHKINLQNSVDLAAYYGAMKQAETFNALSHINYQIRQAYKLLMFRYHAIGTAGYVGVNTPYDFVTKRIKSETDEEIKYPTVFCMGYEPVSGIADNENYCREAYGQTNITLPAKPDLLSGISTYGFLGFYNVIRGTSIAANTAAKLGCKKIAQINYYALSRFIVGYKQDVANRKKVFLKLANEISKDNPRDIEGTNIKEGMFRTLVNNLTAQNSGPLKSAYGDKGDGAGANQVNFEIQNSLSLADCGSKGSEFEPPGWLTEQLFWNPFWYQDADCTGGLTDEEVSGIPQIINYPANAPRNIGDIVTRQFVDQVNNYLMEPPPDNAELRLYHSSMGFEKNPWCMSYMGVTATTTPSIPFSPGFTVTLKATAYAKPFGGKLGTWYGSTWPGGAQTSSMTPEITEKPGPVRRIPGEDIDPNKFKQNNTYVDHSISRYMGDSVGVRSNLTLAYNHRAIFNNGPINLGWWDHLFSEEIGKSGTSNDPLAWDSNTNAAPFLRDMEIEADWYDNYLVKIRRGYAAEINTVIRGDLGYRENANDNLLKKFSIKAQLDHVANSSKTKTDIANKLTYTLTNLGSLLTSWQTATPDNYVLDNVRFGKCEMPVKEEDAPDMNAPGNCKKGARVGYSVKLVSEDYLKNQSSLELGGGGANGIIKNKPTLSAK